jgi:hypothetical protein
LKRIVIREFLIPSSSLQNFSDQYRIIINNTKKYILIVIFLSFSSNPSFYCVSLPCLWPDEDGETCLHRAAANEEVVEELCRWLGEAEQLQTVNRKLFTAAHVAKSAAVLKVLYENGANLWILDAKGRMPLFVASFMGRTDCVSFLVELMVPRSDTDRDRERDKVAAKVSAQLLNAKDAQGDTALHAACVKGHLQCACLLVYHCKSVRNNAQLLPQQLAEKAGHAQVARLVGEVEARRKTGESCREIMGCDFETLSSVLLYYGARWTKGYDHSYDCYYYVDRASGVTQWDRPDGFDEAAAEEEKFDSACNLLKVFYLNFNPDKYKDINSILVMYRNKYTELFLSLAEKYEVEDLSIFDGIDFE